MPPREEEQTQTLEREVKGLMLNPNPYALPEGALLEANNVYIDRPNVISKARGLNRYGNTLSNAPTTMAEFNDKIVVLDGTTLRYDSDGAGNWTALSGTFSAPDANNRMRFSEALFSLYFTTSTGLFRLDNLTTGTPAKSGMPQGLDIADTFSGTGLGFFNSAAQIAYKVVYIKKDSNNQEIIGPPSFRQVVQNPVTAVTWTRSTTTLTVTHTAHGYSSSDTVIVTNGSDTNVESPTSTITSTGSNSYTYGVADTGDASGTADIRRDENVTLVTTIPDDVVAGDFIEIYRTQQSANILAPPGGRYLKVNRVELASGDISTGTISFADTFAEAFLGEDLYDNPEAEGSDQSNFRAGHMADVTEWKGHLWSGNTRDPHRKQLQFLETTGLVDGTSTITIGARTYTFETADNIGSQEFKRETGNATEAENVADTMRNLCRVANRDSGNSVFYLHYISGPNDAPGEILVERRDLVDTALSFTVDASGTGDNFSPVLPTSGTTIQTEATQNTNRIQHSKFEQPDAWPLLNFDDIGTSRSKVLRLIPLRDSLMIFTERGIYRLTGETEQDFNIRPLENEIQLLAPESPAILNDAIWAFTNQGVISLNENGAKVESFFGIDKELQKIQTFSNFKTLTWGMAYEEDHKYFLWTQDQSGDTTVTVAWIYNVFTETWVKRIKKVSCGIVPQEQQLMYLGHAVDTFVLKERKSFTANAADFVDEGIAITITAVSTGTHPTTGATVTELTFSYTYTGTALTTEFGISQSTDYGRILTLLDNGSNSFTATLDVLGANWSAAAATAEIPIVSRIRWAPETYDDPSKKKQFTYAVLSLEGDTARSMQFKFVTDAIQDEISVKPIVITLASGWGSVPWGSAKWGSGGTKRSTPRRVPIPRKCQKCRAISTIIEHSRARSFFDIASLGITARFISSRTNDAP